MCHQNGGINGIFYYDISGLNPNITVIYGFEGSEPQKFASSEGGLQGYNDYTFVLIENADLELENETFNFEYNSNTKEAILTGVKNGVTTPEIVTIPAVAYNGGCLYNVTGIGLGAFDGKTEIKEVIIPDTIKTIEAIAFRGCIRLTNITIPSSVENINDEAFYECSNLAKIIVHKNNVTYSAKSGILFNKNKTTLIKCPEGKQGEYIIPNSVTAIGNFAFQNCNAISKISFEEGTQIETINGFFQCSGLEKITLPDSVTQIESQAFWCCEKLKEINIPDSVENIESEAFLGCTSLTEITIPSSVTSIESEAFNHCQGLTKAIILNRETEIGDIAFFDCNANLTIYGYVGSTSQTYANQNNIKFSVISE